MPPLSQVIFLSQESAEAYRPQPTEAIISITDDGAEDANLSPDWRYVLRVSFNDVDPMESPPEPGEDFSPMGDHHADRIAAFVSDHHHLIATLVVHCRYGQSRSAGVAKAIASHHGLQFPDGYPYANNHVYELVLAALRVT